MENGQPKEKLPLIILNTGWNARMDLPTLKSYAISFALGGPYAVLMYDIRGQGKSPGKHQISGTIFEDVVKVIDFGEKLPEIDPQRIGFWGLSLGAEMALTRVYLDERIKVITAVAAPSNPRENFGRKPRNFIERLTIFYMAITGASLKSIPEEVNKIISPEYFLDSQREYLNNRTFLIHAKDDYIVSFSQFEKNRKILNLPDDHVLILEKGGHTLMQQELLIESNSMRFFKSIL
jgi:dipeptidyl aminopeptidase/acylaminoacyl peptidase